MSDIGDAFAASIMGAIVLAVIAGVVIGAGVVGLAWWLL